MRHRESNGRLSIYNGPHLPRRRRGPWAATASALYHQPPAMSIAMTAAQLRELKEVGFTVLESFFEGEELSSLLDCARRRRGATAPRPGTSGNLYVDGTASAQDEFMGLVDHPRTLPYVVDALGWNIRVRDVLFAAVQPASEPVAPATGLGAAFHYDQEEELAGLTEGGEIPLVDFKCSVYLSDATLPGHSCTMLVP